MTKTFLMNRLLCAAALLAAPGLSHALDGITDGAGDFLSTFAGSHASGDLDVLSASVTYNASTESGVRWNDPEIGVVWPVDQPRVSERDRRAQTLREWMARPEAKNFSV